MTLCTVQPHRSCTISNNVSAKVQVLVELARRAQRRRRAIMMLLYIQDKTRNQQSDTSSLSYETTGNTQLHRFARTISKYSEKQPHIDCEMNQSLSMSQLRRSGHPVDREIPINSTIQMRLAQSSKDGEHGNEGCLSKRSPGMMD